jgi:hypothetical protein
MVPRPTTMWCVVSLTVTIGIEEYQIQLTIILMVTVPVM